MFCFFVSINLPATSEATVTTAAVAAAAEQRLSEERLPREPGPSTDGGRSWPADAQGHHYYRSDQPPPESQQQQQATTSTDMITVAAHGSRSLRPKPRPALPSVLFPVDVTDRLRSPVVSPVRPRQFGRRRSVQDAIVSTVAQQQLQPAPTVAVVTNPDAARESDANEEQEQEQEPRLVAPLRLVTAQYLSKYRHTLAF